MKIEVEVWGNIGCASKIEAIKKIIVKTALETCELRVLKEDDVVFEVNNVFDGGKKIRIIVQCFLEELNDFYDLGTKLSNEIGRILGGNKVMCLVCSPRASADVCS